MIAVVLALAAAFGVDAAAAAPTPDAQDSAGIPAAAARVRLPQPTGAYAVGRETLHLVDQARQDPWVPGGPRELMVDVYYPALAGTGTPARYAEPEEIRRYLDALQVPEEISATAISDTTIASRTGAGLRPGRYGLVVLSPGLGVGRRSLTGLAEQLASLGYVAVSVDHAHESTGTAFPGGRMLGCAACDQIHSAADFTHATRIRAADLSFVIDSLTGTPAVWRGAGIIDSSRIAAVGHSLGGSAAVALLARDRRVHAGVDMDGTLGEAMPAGGVGAGRAVLLLGATANHPGPGVRRGPDGDGSDDPTWPAAWVRLVPPRLWLAVDGADHFSFTDDPVIADQFLLPAGLTAAPQALTGARALDITRATVAAFVDRWLNDRRPLLLRSPADAGYPQVRIVGW